MPLEVSCSFLSSPIMTTLLAAPDELAGINTIDQARAWAGVSDIVWAPMQEKLGTVTNL